ncbi:MAG: hypothetical protein ACE5G0_10275 [Rhodothermales bacterium]
MKRLPLLIVLLLVLGGASLSAFTVKLEYFKVERQNNDFVLSWKTEIEEDVRSYELYRKTSYAATFSVIKTFTPHGVGKEYTFKDDQVYKASSEQVDYRLEAVFSNGLRQHIAEKQLNYTPTAIRRTWGSIKAMFQD